MIRQCNPREEDGSEQGDDDGGTSEDDDEEDDDEEDDDDEDADDTLWFPIKTLPFYLSRAEYEPNLAMHAHSLLNQKIGKRKGKRIRRLHKAIDLYLKVSF